MSERPSGTLTFLFTDVEGSTRLWESDEDAMRVALERHDALVRSAIDDHDGYVFATGGDGFAVAFPRVGDALDAAISAQTALADEPWPDGATIRVRMGLHTGEASERDGDYFGPEVNRAARLMATAHGGQVVCSGSTAALADDAVGLSSLGEHRLRDLTTAEQVFQVGEGTFPPLRSVDAVPTNLPTVRTGLVGRSEEIESLSALTARERLVTLTGVGGVGKTRLALGVAATVAPDYSDGCWLVDLAPVADGSDVPVAVATAVRSPATEQDALATYLADRQMVVVLDNCEHVIADVADLVDAVLAAASDVHLVTTSREPLGLDGEVVRRVDSLGVPDTEASSGEAATVPSVRLFVDRAVAAAEGFTLDADTVGPVVDICRRLDGIPLAIELAAARVRSMPPDEIARRLDERFRLLSGGSRRAQERHRTLAAAVSWSHDLLDGDEQLVFRRLAVFPASFTLEAAEVVAAREDTGVDVVDAVLNLVERSLVQYDPDHGRYRLLETLRQYGADRLAEAGEAGATRARHARFFLGLTARQSDALLGAGFEESSALLLPELDNLRSAAAWCADEEQWTALATLCIDAYPFAYQLSAADLEEWLRVVLAQRAALDPQVLVDLLGEMAFLRAESLGDFAGALTWADQSFDLAEDHGLLPSPKAGVARAVGAIRTGRLADGAAAAEAAAAAAERRDDPIEAVTALCYLANALEEMGQSEGAQVAMDEAMRRARASASPIPLSSVMLTAAARCMNMRATPDFAAGREILASEPSGLTLRGVNAMWRDLMWGWSMLGLGRSGAARHLGLAFRQADQLGTAHAADLALRLLAIALADAGHTPRARTVLAYVNANLARYRFPIKGQAWIEARLDAAGLTGAEPDTRVATRREILTLVTETSSTPESATPGIA